MGLLNWISNSEFGAWMNGRADGKRNIPKEDQTDHPPYVKWLAKIAAENIERIAHDWEKEDEDLKGKYCDAKRDYLVALKELNKERADKGLAEQKFEDALKKKRSSSDYPHMSPLAYKLLIGFIAVGEMPLTAFVFQILGENKLFTFLFAAVLCVSLPVSAHFLGIMIREKLEPKKRIIFATTLLIFLGVLFAVAYMREKFFEGQDVQEIWEVAMDPTVVTVVFITIQLFIFWVGTLASYFAHDPHQDRRRALKEFDDAKEKLVVATKDAQNADAKVDKAAEVLAKIEALREKVFNQFCTKQKDFENRCHRMIEFYRKHNLRVRSDCPISFNSYPESKTPESLKNLNKDCGLTDDMELDEMEKNKAGI